VTSRRLLLAAVLLIAAASHCFPADDPLVFSASGWDFGIVDRAARPEITLTVRNRSADPVTVSVVPACDCLAAEPARRVIEGGATGAFRLSFDPAGEGGAVTRDFVILTDVAGRERMLFTVSGTVEGGPDAGAATGTSARPVHVEETAGAARVRLTYYSTPGCRSCERFLDEEVPRLERELGIAIDVVRRDVLAADGYEDYARAAAPLGTTVRAIPGLLVGSGVLLQGDEEIGARLASVLADAVGTAPAAAATSPAPPASPHGAPASALALLPVLAGGLLDGVNPCAFTTLVFLIASLAAAGRDRRQVLLIGVMFTLAVFATYFAVGLGLLSALRAAVAFPLVARIIRWLLVAVLAVLATLSARDAVLAARGREGDMALQLPDALKRRIRASIRSRVGSTALAAAALGLGFVVSVFEFACTGQVYLPTLAYLARSGDARAVPLLAAYNVAFIAPLVAVFAASWAGVTSYRLGAFLQRHLVAVKAALAVFFAALAALTLAT
jgi:cytochrome c biogenesis protein CcdA